MERRRRIFAVLVGRRAEEERLLQRERDALELIGDGHHERRELGRAARPLHLVALEMVDRVRRQRHPVLAGRHHEDVRTGHVEQDRAELVLDLLPEAAGEGRGDLRIVADEVLRGIEDAFLVLVRRRAQTVREAERLVQRTELALGRDGWNHECRRFDLVALVVIDRIGIADRVVVGVLLLRVERARQVVADVGDAVAVAVGRRRIARPGREDDVLHAAAGLLLEERLDVVGGGGLRAGSRRDAAARQLAQAGEEVARAGLRALARDAVTVVIDQEPSRRRDDAEARIGMLPVAARDGVERDDESGIEHDGGRRRGAREDQLRGHRQGGVERAALRAVVGDAHRAHLLGEDRRERRLDVPLLGVHPAEVGHGDGSAADAREIERLDLDRDDRGGAARQRQDGGRLALDDRVGGADGAGRGRRQRLSGELDRSGERIGAGAEEARGNAARKHLRHIDGGSAADRLEQVDAR